MNSLKIEFYKHVLGNEYIMVRGMFWINIVYSDEPNKEIRLFTRYNVNRKNIAYNLAKLGTNTITYSLQKLRGFIDQISVHWYHHLN